MLNRVGRIAALVLLSCVLGAPVSRAEEAVESESGETPSLYFMPPLVVDSPSPMTLVSFDYALSKQTHESDELNHRIELSGEYAPADWISVELMLPYGVSDRDDENNRHNLANLEVTTKLATLALQDEGVLLGGGLGLILPTGRSDNRIGSDRLVMIEPFVDAGWKRGIAETIAALRFGIPANENGRDPDWSLDWNLSLLVHMSSMMAGVLELDGERSWGGQDDGETVVNVTPGLRWNPSDDPDIWFGTGVSVPLTNDEEFDFQWLLSSYYRF